MTTLASRESQIEALTALKETPLAVFNIQSDYVKQIGDPRRLSDNNNNAKVSDQIKQLLQQDPRLMAEELKSAHDVFQTHKLAYLEHETKVEFLKVLMSAFEDDNLSSAHYSELFRTLDEETIAQEEAANVGLKQKLKTEKRRAQGLQTWVEEEAKKLVVDAVETVQEKPEEIIGMLTEMEEMEREIREMEEEERRYKLSLCEQLGVEPTDDDPVASFIKETEELESRSHELGNRQQQQHTQQLSGHSGSSQESTAVGLESLEREHQAKIAQNRQLEQDIAQLKSRSKRLDAQILQSEENGKHNEQQHDLNAQTQRLLQEISKEGGPDISKSVEEGEASSSTAQQAISWYSAVNKTMSEMLGIDYGTLRLRQRGAHHTLYKFTKQISFTPSGALKKKRLEISYEILVVNLSSKIETAKITAIHIVQQSPARDSSSGEPVGDDKIDRKALTRDVVTQAKALYQSKPSYFVNETCRVIQEKLES